MEPLTSAEVRALKSKAQLMKASVELGKEGVTPRFLAGLNDALERHQLVKVKFGQFKEEKKILSPQIAEKTHSHLVTRVGNVIVLYRPKKTEPNTSG